ncbi:MAG: leucine-rich repeat protein, partial [Oscillospiraceae bacterium]|nr:leucine-rich repeat protein [Oscillospiraceae bacterium]
KTEGVTLCGLLEHKHSELCYNEDGESVCEIVEHNHSKVCYDISLLALDPGNNHVITEGDGWVITVNSDATYTLTYSGKIIPSNFMWTPEVSPYKNNISKLVIKGSVEQIEESAFEGIEYLETVEVEENHKLTRIAQKAFKNCTRLKAINLENFKALQILGSNNNSGSAAYDGETFRNTGLTQITIPSTVYHIKSDTFRGCTKLVNVHFEENHISGDGSFYLDMGAFAECAALESIDLTNVKMKGKRFLFRDRGDYSVGVFMGCTSLKEIEMPENLDGSMAYMFKGCTSLEKIVFNGTNELKYQMDTNFTEFITGTKVRELDFSQLSLEATLESEFLIEADSLETLVLPQHITNIQSNAIVSCPNLKTIIFDSDPDNGSYPKLESIASRAFADNTALTEIDLYNAIKLNDIRSSAFEGCTSLERVVIQPRLTLIDTNVFKNCVNLKDVVAYYPSNQNSAYTFYDGVFEGAGRYRLTISEYTRFERDMSSLLFVGPSFAGWSMNVDVLKGLLDHADSLAFDKNCTAFTVGTDGASTGLKAPFETGGIYFTDSQGNLYRSNGKEAEFVYAARDTKEIVIPETLEYVSKSFMPSTGCSSTSTTVKVTSVGSYAFDGSDAEKVTFENIENIKKVGSYGFANATELGEINGNTTVTEATDAFGEASIGKNAFFNTALAGDVEEKIFETENAEPKGPNDKNITIIGGENNDQNGLQIVLSDANRITDEGENKGKYYTGTNADFNLVVPNLNDGAVYRVYIRINTDKYGEIKISDVDNYKFELCSTDDPYIFYYELQSNDMSETLRPTISLSYPNYMPPGLKAQVWGASLFGDSIENTKNQVIEPGTEYSDKSIVTSDQYFEVEWTTRSKTFKVEKERINTDNFGFVSSSDGKSSALNDLQYSVTYNTPDQFAENIGSDLVTYVDYTDILTLPNGLKWRSGLRPENGRVAFEGGEAVLYAPDETGKEYVVCRLSNFGQILSVSLEKKEGNAFAVHWRVLNPSTVYEISSPENAILAFGNDVILAENLETNYKFTDITNYIATETHYTFSDTKQSEWTTKSELYSGEGSINIIKEKLNTPKYMGEDAEYKITINNPTAFPYGKMDRLVDELSTSGRPSQYIKAENMQKLFDGLDGELLTITITNAVITAPVSDTAVAVDGYTEASLTASNTGKESRYNGLVETDDDPNNPTKGVTIELSKRSDGLINIHLSKGKNITAGKGGDYSDIQSALDSLAYIVTQTDYYTLTWDYPDGYEFPGGGKKEYIIIATVKNSLMNLSQGDHMYHYSWPGDNGIDAYNEATMYLTDNSKMERSTSEDTSRDIKKDLSIGKMGYVDDVPFVYNNGVEDITLRINDGDLIDYKVNLTHWGDSSYETLPLVDKISGMQVLLAGVKENPFATWTSGLVRYTDKAGKEYYVLNREGTYKGVYLGGYYADTVTVSKADSGLETLIKYYIKDTVIGNREYTFTYKTLCSQEYAGNENTKKSYSIGNEAWANDYPTHRIYTPVFVSGSAINFDKSILTKRDKFLPAFDELDPDDFMTIYQGNNVVTYRLLLENKFPDSASITGKDMYDMLPFAGTKTESGSTVPVFEWKKAENIFIEYNWGESEVTLNGNPFADDGSEWSIGDENPNTEMLDSDRRVVGQQYILWDENLNITIPGGGKSYIYVTLTFPDDDDTWNAYSAAIGAGTLINTFYVYDLPESVRHALSNPGKAFLQKGVYEIGHYINDGDYWYSIKSYFMDSDRYHYSNNTDYATRNGDRHPKYSNKVANVVTYYVIIKNSGVGRLYLSPVYDVLPEGFRFLSMRCRIGKDESRSGWFYVGGLKSDVYSVPTQHGGSAYIIAAPEGYNKNGNWHNPQAAGTFKYTNVYYDGETQLTDGRYRVKFSFRNNDGEANAGYDPANGMVYLEENEFIQFAYTVYTGDADLSEAVNTIAMEYIDSSSTGVTADEETGVNVSDYNGKMANDGDRKVWDDKTAEEAGFTEHNQYNESSEKQWLVSDVTIYKGEQSPGITKEVKSPIADAEEPVDWTVTAHNNGGTGAINKYHITDTVESPFRFEGDVKYSVFASDLPIKFDGEETRAQLVAGHKQEQDGGTNVYKDESTLFTIKREGKDTVKLALNGSLNPNRDLTLTVNGDPVTFKVSTREEAEKSYTDCNISVQIKRGPDKEKVDSNGNPVKDSNGDPIYMPGDETLIIYFNDHGWSIPAGGEGKLLLSTTIPEEYKKGTTGIYNNNARLLPDNKDFNAGNITQGKYVDDEDFGSGVENSALVSLITGAPSSAYKEIHEVENPSNYASSQSSNNSIFLDSKDKIFTYTLTVINEGKNAEPMKALTIIDNLPEISDGNTLAPVNGRASEFKVRLANSLDPKVYVIPKGGTLETATPLDPKYYTISFSNKNGLAGNNYKPGDWNGEESWSSTYNEDTRSVRLIIKAPNPDEFVIPADGTVKFCFNAMIDEHEYDEGTDSDHKFLADPAEIAWNSFGYSYDTSGFSAIMASTPKVGIQIPAMPNIKKRIVTSKDEPAGAAADETFTFVIYKGDRVGFNDYTKLDAVEAELAGLGREFTVVKLRVPAGESESETVMLDGESFKVYKNDNGKYVPDDNMPWEWIKDETYNAVEILDFDDYYSFSGIGGDFDSKSNNISFAYNMSHNQELVFKNSVPDWSISIYKFDENNKNVALDGAVFGLYSVDPDDSMLPEDIENLCAELGMNSVPETRTENNVTYYLSDYAVTVNGKIEWPELTKDSYIIYELKAPDGYYVKADVNHLFTRVDAKKTDYASMASVYNAHIPELPSTGGKGFSAAIQILGAFMFLFGVLFFRKRYIKSSL